MQQVFSLILQQSVFSWDFYSAQTQYLVRKFNVPIMDPIQHLENDQVAYLENVQIDGDLHDAAIVKGDFEFVVVDGQAIRFGALRPRLVTDPAQV